MTKEELEKQTMEWKNNYILKLEKRCANYEMEISKMEKGICDICKETEKDKKIAELEKENAKLKVDNAFLENAFKDGAEFGYNKANEWHYVKDEDTPKIEGHYLVCLRNKDKDVFDCWIYYDKDVGWYSLKVRMKDIYAWKKIVLPKEIEK